MKNFFPIFKAGRHTDSSGKVHNYSEEDVKSLVEKYDPTFLRTPFSTDHKKDGPAFGYAKTLKYENGTAYASFDDMSESLQEAVKKDHFGRVSIELFNQPEKGKYLKAISLLGVKTPSIKGMEIMQKSEFSEQEAEEVFAFQADYNEESEEYSLGDGLTDFSEDESTESTSETLALSGNEEDETRFEELQSRITKLEEEKQDLESRFEQTDQERKQAQQRLTEITIDQQRLRFEQWLEEKIAYGSVMPKVKEKIEEYLMALASVQKFMENSSTTEFEEYDSSENNLVEMFQEIINDLPKIVDDEEVATKKNGTVELSESEQIKTEIRKYRQHVKDEQGREISFAEAADAVQKGLHKPQNEE